MASISSLGVGSGLDLGSIVSGLVDAERTPATSRLDFEEQSITTRLSAFGALKSTLSLFQGTLSQVQSASTYNTKTASLSDSSVFSASVTSVADTGSYSVEVEALAQQHSLASNAATAFSAVDDVIGEGTLTIRFGTTGSPYSFTQDTSKPTEVLTISAAQGNHTVSGFRDYINDNDFGVRASIINDGSGYRLILTSEDSGANNSMEITVTGDSEGGDDDNDGLSQLAFNAAAQVSMGQTVVAQDALLKINGLEITRETNTVSGAIDGVTLNLKKDDIGNVVNLSISEDSSSVSSAIAGFVEGYNGLTTTINELTRYDPATDQAGLLIGDFTVRNISYQLRNLVTQVVPETEGSVRSLAEIGITTKSDGSLTINESTLNAAIADDPEGVEALFRAIGQPSDSGVSYLSSTTETGAGSYAVQVSSMATRGVYNGGALASATTQTINADNDRFIIKVDGVTSDSILLSHATYADGDELAEHIEAQINADATLKASGVSVSVDYDSVNNELDFTSSRYGSESSVEFISVDGDTQLELGFGIGQNGADGSDIIGTINGMSATGDGQFLTSSFGDSKGLKLLIDSGTAGNRGTVSFSRGIIQTIDELLDSYLESDGLISSREEGLSGELEDISEQREKLELRLENLEARLIAQYSALDSLIAQFNSTSAFLTQQLANLPEPNSVGNNN